MAHRWQPGGDPGRVRAAAVATTGADLRRNLPRAAGEEHRDGGEPVRAGVPVRHDLLGVRPAASDAWLAGRDRRLEPGLSHRRGTTGAVPVRAGDWRLLDRAAHRRRRSDLASVDLGGLPARGGPSLLAAGPVRRPPAGFASSAGRPETMPKVPLLGASDQG